MTVAVGSGYVRSKTADGGKKSIIRVSTEVCASSKSYPNCMINFLEGLDTYLGVREKLATYWNRFFISVDLKSNTSRKAFPVSTDRS